MPFRFQAKYGLLTYSDCGDLDGFVVSDYLGTLGLECIVAREIHPTTGGTHLHVFFQAENKFTTRNERIFDVEGFHPNISPSRGTPWEGYDYAIKDGDVVAGGLSRPVETDSRTKRNREDDAEKMRMIKKAKTKEEFLEEAENQLGTAFLKSYIGIRALANDRFKPKEEIYQHPQSVKVHAIPELEEWVEKNLRRDRQGG